VVMKVKFRAVLERQAVEQERQSGLRASESRLQLLQCCRQCPEVALVSRIANVEITRDRGRPVDRGRHPERPGRFLPVAGDQADGRSFANTITSTGAGASGTSQSLQGAARRPPAR
jgi:hypothetical protein